MSFDNPLLSVLWSVADVFCLAGSYVLFTHMMAQRRKVMRGEKGKKAV